MVIRVFRGLIRAFMLILLVSGRSTVVFTLSQPCKLQLYEPSVENHVVIPPQQGRPHRAVEESAQELQLAG